MYGVPNPFRQWAVVARLPVFGSGIESRRQPRVPRIVPSHLVHRFTPRLLRHARRSLKPR